MKRFLTALVALVLPSLLAGPLLRLFGHRVAKGARIGFSLLLVDKLCLDRTARIGHLNLIRVKRLLVREGGFIGRSNLFNGPVSVHLGRHAEIGNRNKILRGPSPAVTYGPARLVLGEWAKLTADHRIDCTCGVSFGPHSILAGSGSQLWTHGYVHELSGSGRYRMDGRISIGRDVYIGSASLLTAGVRIADGVIVGAGTTVASNLDLPGTYVSASLRHLPRPPDPGSRTDLVPVTASDLCEVVYQKRNC